MNATIAYIGLFEFPYGQAASKRVLGNIKLLHSIGFEVLVGHGGTESHSQVKIDDYEINCYGLNELFKGKSNALKLYNHIFNSGNNTIDWLSKLGTKPSYIICYGGYYTYSKKILDYCKNNNIKLVFDIVEWYEPTQMMGGKYGFFYNSFLLAFKYIYPNADGVIIISNNLREVFSNNISVVIPPLDALIDTNDISYLEKKEVLSLVYAGSIGNKDYLGDVIKVVDRLSLNHSISFSIYGPTENEIKIKFGFVEIPNAVTIFGKVDQEIINECILESDFTIFIRPDTHCNRYGFPSKFVESLSLGVPVATNLTSDLHLYLKDAHNGFIIPGITESDIEVTILKMLDLSNDEKLKMRHNAFDTAQKYFSCKSIELQNKTIGFFSKISDVNN